MENEKVLTLKRKLYGNMQMVREWKNKKLKETLSYRGQQRASLTTGMVG